MDEHTLRPLHTPQHISDITHIDPETNRHLLVDLKALQRDDTICIARRSDAFFSEEPSCKLWPPAVYMHA